MEKHNLINDYQYWDKVDELRLALYDSLKSNAGHHSVPFHARLAEGMNLRDRNGPKAGAFPEEWKVEPNRPDKYNGLFRDTLLKRKLIEEGKPYFPWLESCECK